ncbi:MAG: MOSC domain-containing protein [Deltaproteobacteria bacterium]|nr:MOSC domain-containing protein [Deltaproteobacteria bacterium]
MRSFQQLEQGWQDGPVAPRHRGVVRLVVARLGGGEHDVLDRGQLTPDDGLVGDRWKTGPNPSVERQITLMETRVAELVADGQPLHMPGDNVLVDLDLGAQAAPTGTRIRLGEAVLEVTDKPHTGCKKFQARFGADAMRWVNAKEFAGRRLRGINCRVVQPGTVAAGDLAENLGPRPSEG